MSWPDQTSAWCWESWKPASSISGRLDVFSTRGLEHGRSHDHRQCVLSALHALRALIRNCSELLLNPPEDLTQFLPALLVDVQGEPGDAGSLPRLRGAGIQCIDGTTGEG